MFLFQFLFPSFSEHFRNIGISVASLSLPRIATPATPNLWARISSAVLTISSPKILAKLASVVATGGRFQAITRNEILLFLRQKAFRDCFFFSPARDQQVVFLLLDVCLIFVCVCVRVSVHSMALTIYIYICIYIYYLLLFVYFLWKWYVGCSHLTVLSWLFHAKLWLWILPGSPSILNISRYSFGRTPPPKS